MSRNAALALGIVFFLVCSSARAAVPVTLIPPVDSPLSRHFEQPSHEYGRGHRGIDYGVVPGVKVRAGAAGTVQFAGSVAGHLAVTLDHGQGLETTYSILGDIYVDRGDEVDEGAYLGTTGFSHPGEWAGLHFAVKLNGSYVDPLDYLGAVDASRAIHLAPLIESLDGRVDDRWLHASESAGLHLRACRAATRVSSEAPPPNDNVAVAIAGINSATAAGSLPKLYSARYGPEALGYERVYRFSYAGLGDTSLHRPYEREDTYKSLRLAADELQTLLRVIARRHPGTGVDVFAHSQGGLVARTALERISRAWDGRTAPVEHLVTYATPHGGAPLAALPERLRDDSITGGWVVDRLSDAARHVGPIPDPEAPAVRQLAPGSPLLRWLATEDMSYGTRVLALGIVNDLLVPPDRAAYAGKSNRVIGPEALFGHDEIVASERARAIAYAFVRDAPDSCPSSADRIGPLVGKGVEVIEDNLARIYALAEESVGGRLVRAAGRGARWVGSRGVAAAREVTSAASSGARWVAARGAAVAREVRSVVSTGGRWARRVADGLTGG